LRIASTIPMLHCGSRLVSMQGQREVLDVVGRPRERRSALDGTIKAKHFAHSKQLRVVCFRGWTSCNAWSFCRSSFSRRFASCRYLAGMHTDVHFVRETSSRVIIRSKLMLSITCSIHSFIHSFIHKIIKVVGANHDHWTSRLKVSDKDTQMF